MELHIRDESLQQDGVVAKCQYSVGNLWVVFLAVLFFSKYAGVKLGRESEKPRFTAAEWVATVFCCSIGPVFLADSVSNPIEFYRAGGGSNTVEKEDVFARSLYRYGLQSWAVQTIVTLSVGFLGFRKGLPISLRCCLYPLIGDTIYSWVGDLVDIIFVFVAALSASTTLVRGATNILSGFHVTFPEVERYSVATVVLVGVLGLAALGIVLYGLKRGLKRASLVCALTLLFLICSIVLSDNTTILSKELCSGIAWYLQEFFNNNKHDTTLYSSLDLTVKDQTIESSNSRIVISVVSGVVTARLSRGRTTREVIVGTLIIPALLSAVVIGILGGAGMIAEEAAASSLCCPADPASLEWNTGELENITSELAERRECTERFLLLWQEHWRVTPASGAEEFREFYSEKLNRYKISLTRPGDALYKTKPQALLSCLEPADRVHGLMLTYPTVGVVYSVLTLLATLLSSLLLVSTGVLVVEYTAGNGSRRPTSPAQRVFWGCLVVGVAVVLATQEETVTSALEDLMLVLSYPATLYTWLVCVSLWQGLRLELGDTDPYGPDFKVGILTPFTTCKPTLWCSFIKNVFLAPMSACIAINRAGGGRYDAGLTCLVGYLLWLGWLVLLGLESIYPGLNAPAWACYILFCCSIARARAQLRSARGVEGSELGDLARALFLYPAVGVQMETGAMEGGLGTRVPKPYRIQGHK